MKDILDQVEEILETPEMIADTTLPINHKGSFCTLTGTFCQEGYCSECEIYQNYLRGV